MLSRGGKGDAAIRQAATECDGWNPAESKTHASAGTGMLAIAALEALEPRIWLLHNLAAEAGRTTPLDVVLARPDPEWRERPTSQVREEVARLGDMAVTWIAVWLREVTSLDEYLAKAEALAALRD